MDNRPSFFLQVFGLLQNSYACIGVKNTQNINKNKILSKIGPKSLTSIYFYIKVRKQGIIKYSLFTKTSYG